MSQRKKSDARCKACRMRQELCLCSEISSCRSSLGKISTRIAILMHYKEERLTTNTGRLAHLAIDGCEIFIRGQSDQILSPEKIINKKSQPLLLYPGDGALSLDKDFKNNFLAHATQTQKSSTMFPQSFTLIVPDGSWRQASKVLTREKWLKDVPRIFLPPSNSKPSRYFLRDEPKLGGLATFEAIARCLGILESFDVQEKLENIFELMVSRTLKSRGTKISA